jgi:hypothetical protein
MSPTAFRRAALFAGAMLFVFPAFAADRPATAEGAKTLQAFFERFLPAPPAGAPPLVAVKPDGASYLVTTDLAAFNGLAKSAGTDASYEPAPLVYRIAEQDDGKWRVTQDSLPRIVSHVRDATSVVDITNYRQTLVIDPAIAWWTSGDASADKGSLSFSAPKVDETIEFGPLKGEYATTVNADGTISSTVKESLADVAFKTSTHAEDDKSVSSSGRIDKAAFNIGVDGLKSQKLMELVTLLSAHRNDLAAHEAELKDLIRPFAAPGLRLVEGGEASKLMVASPLGAVALDQAKLALAVSNSGPDSAIDATIGAEGLSLPAGLLPPNATDLTPSKIDLAFTVKGIDIAAAANQAVDSLHFDGSGARISEDDRAKISTALMGPGPLRVVVAPSHVAAPALDADVSGEIRYAGGKTTGALTVKMRNFDKTMKAITTLGPVIAAKSLPIVAMAKGLAKTESDGSLSWLVEVGDDRSIKVNGIPLGKAPE